MVEKLKEYIEMQLKLHDNDDYLSDYERGVNFGVNDTLDDLVELLNSK